MEQCRICGGNAAFFERAVVLNKYEVDYYICEKCGSIQTQKPYWLNEAYSDAITETDIGICSRNVLLHKKISAIIKLCFNHLAANEKFLDYGGGYGMLVRLLRDNGFYFEWYDKYCNNIFAKTFEKTQDKYKLITAIELFEHLTNPALELKEMLSAGENIIFTTELLPTLPPHIYDWWYYSPENGQHVSFYTEKGLSYLAENNGLKYTGYGNLHILSQKKIPQWKLIVACRFTNIINYVCKRDSLLGLDFDNIRNHLRKN